MKNKHKIILTTIIPVLFLTGCQKAQINTYPKEKLLEYASAYVSETTTIPTPEMTTITNENTQAKTTSPTTTALTETTPISTVTTPETTTNETEKIETTISFIEATISSMEEINEFWTETAETYATEIASITTEACTEAVSSKAIDASTINFDPEYINENTDFSFFNNSIFLGDSVCSGLKVYNGLLPIKNVTARGNVGTWNINDYTFQYDNSTNELPYSEIINLYKPENVFIFLGLNDIYMISAEERLENIINIKDNIIGISPDTNVYVLSITPISENHKWAYTTGKEKIIEYNSVVEEFCATDDSLTYINIYPFLCENNNLLSECDGGDGLHLSQKAYIKILNVVQLILQLENKNE